MISTEPQPLAWVTAADMGLGHKRAAWPLRLWGRDGLVIAGSDKDTSPEELEQWERLRKAYETLSRVKSVPVVGNALFGLMDRLMAIPTAYPVRDLSRSTFQVNLLQRLIRKGLCGSFIEKAKSETLPIVTTFYAQAMAAEQAGFQRIYCVICDADVNRVWVGPNPEESRIEYFVPCGKAMRRLRQYGVADERIFMTGFPFPLELIGDAELSTLKVDLGKRLARLDPNNRFWPLHRHSVEHFLGGRNCPKARGLEVGPLTITFAVGGAGAQREIGVAVMRSISGRLAEGSARMNLVAGKRSEVFDYFTAQVESLRRENAAAANNVRVVYHPTDSGYFTAFNEILHETDVLWTKPSELSFYTGLGIPIVMAPTIGSQEDRNREWLHEVQGGIDQLDEKFTHEWLWDLLNEGRLAESAWDGFLKARKYGTYKVVEVLQTGTMVRESSPLKR